MTLKRLGFVAAGLIVLLVVIPFLVPTGTYIRQAEQAASQALGAPVTIKSLHVAVLPSPRAIAGGIVVGKDAEIRLARVTAVLDLATLFHEVREISRLEIRQPVIKKAALDMVGGIAAKGGESTGSAPVVVRRVLAREARLEWPEMDLPPLDADIAMTEAGKLEQATVNSSDGNLSVVATPRGDGFAAEVKARNWTLPVGAPVHFDSLTATLEYAGTTLNVPNIEAGLYKGKLSASARLEWKKDRRLSGKFKTRSIELRDASKPFTSTTRISGAISGNGSFGSTAKQAALLGDRLVVDYRFDIANGVLYGVDLAKAASLLVRQGQTGGETRFDQLSGTLHMVGGRIELRDAHAASGALAARGHVRIMPDKRLDGEVNTELKKGVSLASIPLEVSGTVDKPLVLPTKAALAGAAAGTAMLGPGVGTGVGVKAGSAIDKLKGLFGGGNQ